MIEALLKSRAATVWFLVGDRDRARSKKMWSLSLSILLKVLCVTIVHKLSQTAVAKSKDEFSY